MDFVFDALFDERRLRLLTVINLYTRECLGMPTSTGYPPLLTNSPLPVSPQKMQFSFALLKIEVTNNGKRDVTMPDGTIQRAALDAVNQQHEVQMMSAQGLQGSWQWTGNNAESTPSSLLRSK